MQKNITKTESVAEFVARGGTITKCAAKNKAKRRFRKVVEEAAMEEVVDVEQLPETLKIRLGIR